jgi:hypothetical protein
MTRGDNASVDDGVIPSGSALGVVGIERDGTRIRTGLGPERVLIALLSRWGVLKSFVGVGAAIVGRIRRSL